MTNTEDACRSDKLVCIVAVQILNATVAISEMAQRLLGFFSTFPSGWEHLHPFGGTVQQNECHFFFIDSARNLIAANQMIGSNTLTENRGGRTVVEPSARLRFGDLCPLAMDAPWILGKVRHHVTSGRSLSLKAAVPRHFRGLPLTLSSASLRRLNWG